MKKIILLIFATTLLFGCKKQRVKKDIIGEWHFVEDSSTIYPCPCKKGFIFKDNGDLISLSRDSNFVYSEYANNATGLWELKKKDKLVMDFGDLMYPASGTYDCFFDDEFLSVNGFLYQKVEHLSE